MNDIAYRRVAVISRRVVFVLGSVLFVGGVLAFLNGRVALGIALVVVAGLAVMARGLMTVMRGQQALAGREQADVPDGPVRGSDGPAPVDEVVGALVGMNSDGLPCRIEAKRTADGVRVDVRWRTAEMRWQTLFVRGSQAYAWRKGKTSGSKSATFVEGADGQVRVTGQGGSRTSWEGAVTIRPADVKIPVLSVLRANGWRPRFDWFGARLFEK